MIKLSKRDILKESQSLDVVIEPMDPAVQQAVQKIKQIDPYVFKNVTKIIVHPGGGGGQLGHVEKGPGKDPHEIHVFKDRIKEIVTKQYRNVTDPKALQDAITLSLIEVIGHESGHIGKNRTEEQITQTPFLGEGEAEARGKELANKAKPLFVNHAYLKASLVLDEIRKKLDLPMSEPTLSFLVKASNDNNVLIKEGLEILQSDTILPAMVEIEDAIDFNKQAVKDFKVIKVLSIIQDKVGIEDYTSKDFVTSLAQVQFWMGLEPNGKLDKITVSKFSQPNKNLPRNFGVVVPGNLYRGGIIDNEQQLKILKDLFGVERIISLHENDDIKEMCKKLNIEHKIIPLENGKEEERILFNDNVSKILNEKPTYIHCLFGQDRTGGVIARYRTENKWPCQLAYLEAKAYGFQDKFPDLIDWFCEPANDKPPVDTQKIRKLLPKEQNSIDSFPVNPTPNDTPFTNPFNPSEEHNYLIWSDTINNINPSMSLNGVSAIAKEKEIKLSKRAKNKENSLSIRDKRAYINEVDKVKEVEDILKEEGEDGENAVDVLAGTTGLRGDVKPEEPWGGFHLEPYFSAKGEPTCELPNIV